MRKLATFAWVVCLAGLAGTAGCVGDPNDPKTWIKKLDDPRESKEAIRMLVKLKDKSAVPALIEVYKKNHDPGVLKSIASFHDPASIPVMIDSLEYTEEAFDSASVAAAALGELKAKEGVEGLIKATLKPLPVKTRANVVKLEAMKSLAAIKDPRATDALIKVLGTSADEQDFFLNQVAARSLGDFAEPKATGVLIRGLFMVGRGANIYQECRAGLISIGEPAVDKLVEAMQRKDADLEADAKKYEFFPGIVVQKTASILGDLHSKKAVPALLAQLEKPDEGIKAGDKGVSEHQPVLQALGLIGDPSTVKVLVAIAGDKKKHYKERIAAIEGLNLLGDPSALPVMLAAANTPFVAKQTIDPEAALLAASGAVNYGRLAVADTSPDALQKIAPKPAEGEEDWFADIRIQFQAAKDRIAVAKECGADAACYEKHLTDKDENKAEKAAFMLARMGKPGMAPLCRHVDVEGALSRMTILYGMSRVGDKSPDCVQSLDKQIEKDGGKPQPYRQLVQEMKVVRAQLTH